MPYRINNVFLILGTILDTVGPGISAFNTCIDLSFLDNGTIAITNANTPIPPIKWVNDLQNNKHFDRCSTSLYIVAPVVVNPDTVSKKASKNDSLSPIINGIHPIKLINIHDTVTIQKPSLAYRFLFLGFRLFYTIPNIILIDVGIRNGVIDSL